MKLTKNLLVAILMLVSLIGSSITAFAQSNTPNVSFAEKQETVKDETLNYYVGHLGKAEKDKDQVLKNPVLVIHGAWMNQLSTRPVAAELVKTYPNRTVVQLELPAHGKSVGPAKESVSEIADVVKSFVDQLREKGQLKGEILLVGWSMGGSTSLELALKNLEGLEGIVLLMSSPEWSSLGVLKQVPLDAFRSTIENVLLGDFKVGATPEQIAAFEPHVSEYVSPDVTFAADLKALMSFDLRASLKDIHVPVLILSGELDQIATLDNQYILHHSLPTNSLVIFPGDSHTVLIKQPEEVAKNIINYFGK